MKRRCKVPEYKGKPGPDGPSKYTPAFINKLTGKLKDFVAKNPWPIFAEFCYETHIDKRLAIDLCKASSEFSEAFREMKHKAEAYLSKVGISGKANGGFVKFLMVNNHKRDDEERYRDKQDIEHTGKDGRPIQIVFGHRRPKENKE